MSTVSSFLRTWAEERETSDEIAMAIFLTAVRLDDVQRLWENPSPEEVARVVKRAWELADPEEGALYWGTEIFMRSRVA
jgi:hypothetical protein